MIIMLIIIIIISQSTKNDFNGQLDNQTNDHNSIRKPLISAYQTLLLLCIACIQTL